LFRGFTAVNLDEKSRFAVPTRYRDKVRELCASQFVATVAVDEQCAGIRGCLWIYPKPEFERVEAQILQIKNSSAVGGKLRRFLIGYANECEMDSQGRILIPEALRKFASLDKKIVLVGQINRFELWNEEAWSNKEAEFLESTSAEELEELGDLSF